MSYAGEHALTFHACPTKHENERGLTRVVCFPVQVSVRVMWSQIRR